jgi:hypothetical protein
MIGALVRSFVRPINASVKKEDVFVILIAISAYLLKMNKK